MHDSVFTATQICVCNRNVGRLFAVVLATRLMRLVANIDKLKLAVSVRTKLNSFRK
jgi:hypothetical protein